MLFQEKLYLVEGIGPLLLFCLWFVLLREDLDSGNVVSRNLFSLTELVMRFATSILFWFFLVTEGFWILETCVLLENLFFASHCYFYPLLDSPCKGRLFIKNMRYLY